MTQTSGKTGPGVGVGRGKRGSRGPVGEGRRLIPLSRQWRPRSQGEDQAESSVIPSVIIRSLLGTAGKVEPVVPWGGGIWGCKLDFPRHVTLSLNLALLPADPRESQSFGAVGPLATTEPSSPLCFSHEKAEGCLAES